MDVRYKKMFDSAISNKMQERFSRFKIDRSGKEIVSQAVFGVHALLMKDFQEECESGDRSVLQCAQAAVGKSLPADIRRNALAEANRKVFLFQRGAIAYDPAISLKRLVPVSIFKEEIKKLPSTGAAPPFSDSGCKKMAEALCSGLDFLSTKVAVHASRQNLAEVGSEHVMEVVKETFTENLFRHAVLRARSRAGGLGLDTRRAPKRKKTEEKSTSRKKTKSGRKRSSASPRESKRRDPSAEFKTGNNKILQKLKSGLTVGQSVRLTAEANVKVSQALHDIASFLSGEVSADLGNRNLREVDFLDVRRVLGEHLSRSLFEHADLSGLKTVRGYAQGELKYVRRRQPAATAAKSITFSSRTVTEK